MVYGLKVEDKLEGASNFTSWDFRILVTLKENDLVEFVQGEDQPVPEDKDELLQFKKNVVKAKKILIDTVKDHLVPIISKMSSAQDMFKALEGMYEINNTSRDLALRQQLHQVKMAKGESVITYFMKISELRDHLSSIGDEVVDKDLVMLAFKWSSSLLGAIYSRHKWEIQISQV
ncbi:uncharacterized protein LOC131874390 [Cryptomeria japonica]|uniref:uncharacterized protein LOC131874390 n=1 Tax=Cryptomeria japonica TaxID=3369 RepID=UPI0027DA10F2|nr:uncharacterized protein LOC131874390 [Cryptomeria japonica]